MTSDDSVVTGCRLHFAFRFDEMDDTFVSNLKVGEPIMPFFEVIKIEDADPKMVGIYSTTNHIKLDCSIVYEPTPVERPSK